MDVHECIRNRRSVRAFRPDPIPPEKMERLRDALRLAPSACNFQPWHFIWVEDSGKRDEIARLSKSQRWIADAPLVVVACGFPPEAYKTMGGHHNSVDIDVAIAVDHLTLAAAAEGLGTCWIGAFDEAGVKHLLEIPASAKVVAMVPVGIPASADMNRPISDSERKRPDEIFSVDRFGGPR